MPISWEIEPDHDAVVTWGLMYICYLGLEGHTRLSNICRGPLALVILWCWDRKSAHFTGCSGVSSFREFHARSVTWSTVAQGIVLCTPLVIVFPAVVKNVVTRLAGYPQTDSCTEGLDYDSSKLDSFQPQESSHRKTKHQQWWVSTARLVKPRHNSMKWVHAFNPVVW